MNTKEIIHALGEDITTLITIILSSNSHKAEMTNSDIYESLSVVVKDDGDLIFDIVLKEYLTYVESGRRAGAEPPPIESIEAWARRHNISTDNDVIWAIREAIARDGIKPRPFMDEVFSNLDEYWEDEWADKIFDKIIKLINDFFNK